MAPETFAKWMSTVSFLSSMGQEADSPSSANSSVPLGFWKQKSGSLDKVTHLPETSRQKPAKQSGERGKEKYPPYMYDPLKWIKARC